MIDIIHKHSIMDSMGNVIEPEQIIISPAHEKRVEEVELRNETYTLDLAKYPNINLLYIKALYNENDITAPAVKIGDLANFEVNVNGTVNFPHKGYLICYPTDTTPITSIVINYTDNRKSKFYILFTTKA